MIDRHNFNFQLILGLPKQLHFGFVFLCASVLTAVLMTIWAAIPEDILSYSKTSVFGFAVIGILRSYICFLLPLVFLSTRYVVSGKNLMGKFPGIGILIISILAGFPASLIFTALHNLSLYFYITNHTRVPLPAIFYAGLDRSPIALALILIAGVLLPSIAEGVFFRGLLFASLPKKCQNGFGIIIIAFLFAVFMLNPIDFWAYFFLGLLLGYIRMTTDSVISSILTQCAMVGFMLILSALIPYIGIAEAQTRIDIDPSIPYVAITSIVIGLLALGAVVSQLQRNYSGMLLEKSSVPETDFTDTKWYKGWSIVMSALFLFSLWSIIMFR